MALTNNEKQAAFRKRNAEAGKTELRGLYLTEKEKDILKIKIKEWVDEK